MSGWSLCGHTSGSLQLSNEEFCTLGQVTFSPKPVFHCVAQRVDGNFGADLDHSVGRGQRVIDYAGVGEIPHAEAVHPLQQTRMPRPVLFVLDSNLAREHFFTILNTRKVKLAPRPFFTTIRSLDRPRADAIPCAGCILCTTAFSPIQPAALLRGR